MLRNGARMESLLLLLSVLFSMSWITSAQSSVIVFHVSEEVPSGTPVGNVKEASNVSQEVAEGEADRLQFQILSADGLRITSIFNINSRTGAIFTNAMIDREQICNLDLVCQLEFDVTVKSDANFVKLLTVRVIVDDINDNAPTFPKSEITLTVPESAPLNSEIPISGALDRDSGINAAITYSLQLSSVFRLKEVKQLDGSSALKLLVQRALDREAVASYSFLILASDGQGPASRTGTLTVGVVVTDVNDNVPKFTKETFNMTVMETAPVGTVFGHLTATDGDVGANGDLSYRFSLLTPSDVTSLFSLNASSGELVVAAGLQYESGRSFQCVVEVMDHGVPPQVSQALLHIHVADAGNTPPKLSLTLEDPVFGERSAMLPEDVQLGTFVGTLKVEDLDEGPEGKVNCSSLDPHFALQELDTNRYWIVVRLPLDREEQPEMGVALVCTDSGSPRLTASASFSVIVRDVNDNAPEFSERVYRTWARENEAGEQSVTRVAAADRDDSVNGVVTYSLDPQSARFFSIDAATGRITTTAAFDREVTPVITLTVYAVDSGVPALTGTASVSVTIADVNDNPPYVNRTDYYVSENVPVGHLFHVNVADEDAGANGTVVVTLLTLSLAEEQSPFSVLGNGSVVVTSMLDREKQALYTLPVLLTDGGSPPLTATATLTVHVVDSNDHAPTFLFPTPDNSSVHVGAGVPVGSQVCRILAEDDDMGSNGRVVFAIADGNSGRWFGINNQTGDIFVIRDLSDVAGTTVHAKVAALDLGTPPLSSVTFLDIYIRPTNGSFLLGAANTDEDRYIVIAGIIAGVTFVISVVVIAVIVHMRNSDLRRQAERRSKELGSDTCSPDKSKNLNALCHAEQVVAADDEVGKNNGVSLVDGGFYGHDLSMDNGGFEPQTLSSARSHQDPGGVLTEEALDHLNNAPFSLFPEGHNRLVGEDHSSDTSGETTTCDSGRGASDEEIVYPLTGKNSASASASASAFPDSPPRIPPREPLSAAGQWSRNARVVSTNWSHVTDAPQFVTDESSRYATEDALDTDASSSSPAGDFRSKTRKGPLRVRFSFDGGDIRSQGCGSVFNHGADNGAYTAEPRAQNLGFDANGQPCVLGVPGDGSGGLPSASSSSSSGPPAYGSLHHHQAGSELFHQSSANGFRHSRQSEGSDVNFPGGLRLHPESLYPRLDRFPRKRASEGSNPLPAWERQQTKSRNSESLSSLPQSVEDDVSTTTSGSYSIDFDDVLNASLEC